MGFAGIFIAGDTNVTRDDDLEAPAGDCARSGADDERWTPAEQALLDAALEFYGAAEAVIEFAGLERPQLRQDAAAFKAVQAAMGVLEARILAAHAAGVGPARIAEVARVEHEMVTLILARHGAAPSPAED